MPAVILICLVLLSCPGGLSAQPTLPPGYIHATLASGLSAAGGAFAVDSSNNVYLQEAPGFAYTGITRVDPLGNVTPGWSSVLGVAGQLVRHPLTGRVHAVHEVPVGPTMALRVSRLEYSGATTVIDSIMAVSGRGLAIDNQGTIFVGTPVGIYRRPPGGSGFALWHAGSGQNDVLLAQVDGSILIGDGYYVRRVDPTGSVMTDHYGLFIGNQFSTCSSLARIQVNALGAGVYAGFHAFVTLCGCSSVQVATVDLQANPLSFFATEQLGSGNIQNGWISDGLEQDLFWYALGALHRIFPLPSSTAPGGLTLAVLGPPPVAYTLQLRGGGPDPYLLAADVPGTRLEVLPYGISATSLGLAPGFIPVIDGLGLFGPPDPVGVLDATGQRSWGFLAPFPPLGLSLQLQAYIPDLAAPNGLVYLTNSVPLTL